MVFSNDFFAIGVISCDSLTWTAAGLSLGSVQAPLQAIKSVVLAVCSCAVNTIVPPAPDPCVRTELSFCVSKL